MNKEQLIQKVRELQSEWFDIHNKAELSYTEKGLIRLFTNFICDELTDLKQLGEELPSTKIITWIQTRIKQLEAQIDTEVVDQKRVETKIEAYKEMLVVAQDCKQLDESSGAMKPRKWLFKNYPATKSNWGSTGHDYKFMFRMMEEYHKDQSKLDEWVSELEKGRFWSYAEKIRNYCWEWRGCLDKYGYGKCRIDGEIKLAHRTAYEITHGRVSENLCILHKCDNPSCINPEHLFTGTHADNMLDKTIKGRGLKPGRKSKYVGVVYRGDSGNWRSYISTKGVAKWLGTFKTQEDAAFVRNSVIKEKCLPIPLARLPKDFTPSKKALETITQTT